MKTFFVILVILGVGVYLFLFPPGQKLSRTSLVRETLCSEFAKKMYKERGMRMSCTGGSAWNGKVSRLSLNLYHSELLTVDEGRALAVELNAEFLDFVNSKQSYIDDYVQYPMTIKNVEVPVFSANVKGVIPEQYIASASVIVSTAKMLYLWHDDIATNTIGPTKTESLREALQILQAQGRLSERARYHFADFLSEPPSQEEQQMTSNEDISLGDVITTPFCLEASERS